MLNSFIGLFVVHFVRLQRTPETKNQNFLEGARRKHEAGWVFIEPVAFAGIDTLLFTLLEFNYPM